MNSNAARLIAVVVTLIFITAIVIMMFVLPGGSSNEGIDYDSKAGILVIDSEKGFVQDTWIVDLTYEEDGKTIVECSGLTGVTSSDHMKCTVTDDKLVNLQNRTYDIKMTSYSEVLTYSFTVSDHEMTSDELTGIIICIGLFVLVFAIIIVRRIVRGRW